MRDSTRSVQEYNILSPEAQERQCRFASAAQVCTRAKAELFCQSSRGITFPECRRDSNSSRLLEEAKVKAFKTLEVF
jgi:hypothetical protein